MKNSLKLLVTLLFMTCATVAFAESKMPIPLEQEEVININKVDPEILKGFIKGQFPTVVLKINHNEKIPLDAFIDEKMENLAREYDAGLFFRTNKDLYLRNVDGVLSYKTRSSEWKDAAEYVAGIKAATLKIRGPKGLNVEIGGLARKNA